MHGFMYKLHVQDQLSVMPSAQSFCDKKAKDQLLRIVVLVCETPLTHLTVQGKFLGSAR